MRRLLVLLVAVMTLAAGVAWASGGSTARLFVDGSEVAAVPLEPGDHTLRLTVDGLLDETFEVSVPSAQHIVIDSDTTVMGEVHRLRPGDTMEFRNGARLMIHTGASVDWQGTPTFTWGNEGLDFNLDRDVRIFGHGDIMFMEGSLPSILRFVEIDLQPTPERGHYPLHWHLVGDGTRGTLVEGVVVKNSTNRAFVPHGSHGITFRDTIAYNISGEAYWWDPPPSSDSHFDQSNNSEDILYERALAHTITNEAGDNRGFNLAGFELGAGVGNAVRDSVARNIRPSHVKDCSGFKWRSISIHQPGNWVFENSRTYQSRCHGIHVWQNSRQDHVIDGFVSTEGINHGAYTNRYHYENVQVPYVIIHAVGWSMRGGSVDWVRTRKHQREGVVSFVDVAIQRITISNTSGSDPQPGHYSFTNPGIGCADVEWNSWVEGTSVTIDGVDCPPPG